MPSASSGCPRCGAVLERRPSYSGNSSMEWLRCAECGWMCLVKDGVEHVPRLDGDDIRFERGGRR